jgi:hypothetical protein
MKHKSSIGYNGSQIYVVFNTKFNKMEGDKILEQNLDNSNEKLHISDVRRSLYHSFFPNFTPLHKPSRTESVDSDLIIDRNGRRKNPIL